MNRATASLLFSSLAVLSTACGPAGAPLGNGKTGAAQALFHAMRPATTEPSAAGGSGAGIDVISTSEVKGRSGGTATVTFNVSVDQTGGSTVTVKRSIKYADFSDDGKTRYHGTLAVDLLVQATTGSAVVKYSTKGRVDLTGEVADFIDADTSLEVNTTDLSSSAGNASVKLNGAVITSGGTYNYANEAINFDVAAGLPTAGNTP
jgi:hypothetical protein